MWWRRPDFLSDFLKFETFFLLSNIFKKLAQIKEYRLKLKSMWFGEKQQLAGGFFTKSISASLTLDKKSEQ